MKNKKTVLVTGAAGFIGSHLVDILLEKKIFTVIAIDNLIGGNIKNIEKHFLNKNFKFYKKNILNIDEIKIKKNIDYIFHFAGIGDIVPSIERPKSYFDTNVSGTLCVLEFSRKYNLKKFVYAASSSCYGIANTPTDEKHKIDPQYPYALSKYFGEQMCFHWMKVYNIPVNSIRIFNAYGPRYKTTGAYGSVIGVFLKQMLSNKPLTVVGSGRQKRDYCHVKDVTRAFYNAAISSKKGQIWNLGYGKPETINKLIKHLNYKKRVKIPKRPGEPYTTHSEVKKIKKDLSWKPKISFRDGIRELLINIGEWENAPLWTPSKIKKATKSWFKYLK